MMGSPNQSAATQDFIHCMPRKECVDTENEDAPVRLVAHFEGLTEDQARVAIAAISMEIALDLIAPQEGTLVLQMPMREREAVMEKLKGLPGFISCGYSASK
jgi:hypothetical protein